MPNHMFTDATIGTISGGTFINNNSEKAALDKLSIVTAHGALHDAPARTDESRCHPHTRTNVLDHLERWAQGICDEGTSVFWLRGGAGAGKSAVMQTLAERFVAQELALGSFFFSRSDSTRNTAEALIPTLVYQLSQIFPSALEVLEPVLNRDPLIFRKSLRVQLLSLLVQPLNHLMKLGALSNAPQSSRVFLIDGLDECNDPVQQQAIIQAVAAVCYEHHIPVKFLIASRPEITISTSFRCYKQENRVLGDMSLSEDPDAEADIRRFIEDECLKVRLRHPFNQMIPSTWPHAYDINRLVWKASSHFIYVSTSMKYIWSAKENPVRSLQVILGLEISRTTSPFSELDALYHYILASATHLDKVLQLLAHCIYTVLPSSTVSMVSFMLGYSEDDIYIYLSDITPLVALIAPTLSIPFFWEQTEPEVKLLHASFGDFLRDPSRSGPLHVNDEQYLASRLEKCFQKIDIYRNQLLLQAELPRLDEVATYCTLTDQITQTVQKAGHLVVTQQVLRQYGLLKFFEGRLCIHPGPEAMPLILADFFKFFLAVHSIKSSEGTTLFKTSVEDFLTILDTHTSLRKTPLVAALFRSIFTGYLTKDLWEPLAECFPKLGSPFATEDVSPSVALATGFGSTVISTAQLASFQNDLDTSSKYLLMTAAEAILRFLIDDAIDLDWPKQSVRSLFDALLWMLPKAAKSQKVALYSKRITVLRGIMIYRNIDQHRIHRITDCLITYNTRVQKAKLKVLDQRIQNGDVNALIKRSRMLLINMQD